jgi:hypothetical protein
MPSVYLGVRLTAEPHGYLDPLSLLPARQSRAADPAPAPEPAPVEPPAAAARQAEPPTGAAVASRPTAHAAPMPPPAARASRTRAAPRAAATTSRATRSARPVQRARIPVVRRQRSASRPRRARQRRSSPLAAKKSPVRSASAPAVTRTLRAVPRQARERPAARDHDRSRVWLLGLALVSLGLCALGVVGRRRRAAIPVRRALDENVLRKMSEAPVESEEHLAEPHPAIDSRRRRVAVCERPTAHRPCRRVRGPFRRLRALSPAARQQRPHGQRVGRARDARDGRRRSRGSVTS